MASKDEIVKDEILKHAQKLFQQYGLKKTTMDEIAAACGKAKSTLYHYFKNKEEVFEHVFEEELRNLRISVKEKVDKTTAIKDKLSAYFVNFHMEILDRMNLYRTVKLEVIKENYRKHYLHKLMGFETSYVTRLLQDAYDTGEFNGVNRDDIRCLQKYYWLRSSVLLLTRLKKTGTWTVKNSKRL